MNSPIPTQQALNPLAGQVLSPIVGTLPESYNFAADVLEDIVGALAEEGHALSLCQRGFFTLAIKTYRRMGLVQ